MNRKYPFFSSICILSILFSLMAATAAWAEQTTESSRVIVCGASSGQESDVGAQSLGGPGEASSPVSPSTIYQKGESLGMFTTTGYCNGTCCGGGSGLTYSGTVPQANHTISADLSKYPIGTKLMIHDIVYTVEDMGSSVKGNWVDIFYDTHEEALNHGKKTEEVFTVIE